MSTNSSYLATQFPLSISKFKAILENKGTKEVAGYARLSTTCPIALALKKDCEGWDTYVRKDITFFGGHIYENPEWVREFVRQIDGYKEVNDSITVKEALEVINSI